MTKTTTYPRALLNQRAFIKIVDELKQIIDEGPEKEADKLDMPFLKVEKRMETWDYDGFDEFLADLKDFQHVWFGTRNRIIDIEIHVYNYSHENLRTEVRITSTDRGKILRLSNIIAPLAEECVVPQQSPLTNPIIFIGHGHSTLWREVKDHLQEKHFYKVEAYEMGPNAGRSTLSIVRELTERANFAILVMTAEDKMDDGQLRARQNVVHEIGLMQGRLGLNKLLILEEAGVEPFTNLTGVESISFSRGNIRETFGEIVATLKREFPRQS